MAGVFYRLWESGLLQLHVEDKPDWHYQSIDGCQTKAPLGGEAVGANPTDRGKGGVKRHLLTEAGGLPVGLVVTGANVHDVKKVETVLDTMPFLPPLPNEEHPQHFCADKAYDSKELRSAISLMGYVDHIKSRWQEKEEKKIPGYRARRWVCERTHSWLNRFKRLLIRWEKKVKNYEALLQLSCAHIIWKHSQLFFEQALKLKSAEARQLALLKRDKSYINVALLTLEPDLKRVQKETNEMDVFIAGINTKKATL